MLNTSLGNLSVCIKVLKMCIPTEPAIPLVKNLEANGQSSTANKRKKKKKQKGKLHKGTSVRDSFFKLKYIHIMNACNPYMHIVHTCI